ncbi:cell wall-binding repeat-containing protein [Herbiconiux sp.]|uniref:cell wall-binding repeat-containing protein n=1 Tax=Herbiconiux sp. TaxID=1871186 RepID=UPI0025BDC3A6|nr:cell wall-binding repeat-containing protein [Herbiconiux sp.]
MAASPATAAPATPPVPAGVYLESTWVVPGGTAWVDFVGDTGCERPTGAAFRDSGTSVSTPLAIQGFGEGFWVDRGVAFVDAVTNAPLPIGAGAPATGTIELTCPPVGAGASTTVSLPITVSTVAPASIYHSPTAWTWYTPGALTAGALVTINALGFRPGESVTVTLTNATRFSDTGVFSSATPAVVTADGEGAVTAQVTFPSGWTAGDELDALVAGASSRYLLISGDGEPVNGDPTLTLSSDGLAIPGATVTLAGAGFVAGETVAVALHSPTARALQLGTLTADGSGAIAGDVSVPPGVASGSYQLWAGAKTLSYHIYNTPILVGSSSRISAPDRFSNAVEIAKAAFPGTAPVVYVATGLNYPDALGAGAAASNAGGPLLLTTPAALPAGVKAEIKRLDPDQIVVVGGPNSVSDAVFTELKALAPNVVRQGGADRYEASRNIVGGRFEHATTAFLATGANFPDALSATSAAASQNAPVILVPGSNPSLDGPTLALLTRLGVTDITITGGPNSVSPAIEAQLKSAYGASHVTRLGGADRFEASATINSRFFDSASEVFLATGGNFPDALAGGVLAASKSAPLLVVHGDCVPATTLAAIRSWGATKITLIGGPASLDPKVATLRPCA